MINFLPHHFTKEWIVKFFINFFLFLLISRTFSLLRAGFQADLVIQKMVRNYFFLF